MTPLTGATLLFATGILAGARWAASPGGPILFWVIAMGAAVALLVARSAALRPATAGCFFAAGLLAGWTAGLRATHSCVGALPADAAVVLHGTFEAALVADASAPFALRAVGSSRGGAMVRCGETVRVRFRPRAFAEPGPALPRAGEAAALHARWRPYVQRESWPRRPLRLGSFVVDSAAGGSTSSGSEGSVLLRARGAAQQELRRLFGARAPMAEALLLARREGLDPAVRERFVAAGLAHLLAISGTHVALFAGVLALACAAVRAGPAATCVVAAGGSVAYVLFLGAPHAAARAALQVVLFLSLRLVQRPVEAVSAVALAALLLLCVDALALLDPGFQLSFAGVLGIVRLRRPIIDALPRVLPRALRDAIATGIAATIPTTPLAALHFQQYSLVGIPAGVVAIPVLALIVPALAVTLLLGIVLPGAASFVAGGVSLLLAALDGIATTAAAIPFGHGHVTPHAVVAAALGGVLFVVLARPPGARSSPEATGGARRWRAAVVGACVAILGPPVASLASGRHLDIYAIDVGQGDAFALRTPRGRWILVDAGPASVAYDAGERTVVPFLRRQGVRRIDVMLLSHPDADHVGGARAVLEAFDVRVIADPAGTPGKATYHAAILAAQHRASTWIAARPGRTMRVDGVEIEFLFPPDSALDGVRDANDYSAVFRLRYGRFVALFLGDAPVSVENALVREHGNSLEAHVLKVGHHGSRTSTGDSLLAAVRAELALVSVGRRNRYGHPAREVIERLGRHGVRVLRTDSAGTFRVRATAGGRTLLREE